MKTATINKITAKTSHTIDPITLFIHTVSIGIMKASIVMKMQKIISQKEKSRIPPLLAAFSILHENLIQYAMLRRCRKAKHELTIGIKALLASL